MKATTLGIDLAKNVFQAHGVEQHGKVMLKKQLKLAQIAPFFINLPPCLVGIEACGSAHHHKGDQVCIWRWCSGHGQ